MYPKDVRRDAVAFFKQGYSPREVTRMLNGPSWWAVNRWHDEFVATGTLKERRVREGKFTDEQKRAAVDHYLANGKNQSKTVEALGYPSRTLLCAWVDELAPGERRRTKPHGRANAAGPAEKAEIVSRCCSAPPGSIKKMALAEGIDPVTLYNWRKELLGENAQVIVDDINRGIDHADVERLGKEVEGLKAEIRRLKMEKAVWKGAVELVKKDPGADPTNLTNREKATLVGALRGEFPVTDLLSAVGMAKSSYYYQRGAMARADKYAGLRERVSEIFRERNAAFGSLRIWAELRRGDDSHGPVVVSEKVIRRIMAEEGLEVVYAKKKKRKWSSYGGEVGAAPKNLVERDFHSDAPNKLWLTDITEFGLPFGKVYLSPIIDCFDGMVVSWTTSDRPTGKLATDMLEAALDSAPEGIEVTCHSDRGLHYRTHDWIDLCSKRGVTRSMSKKGCSPDNSACEGFFGRLKNEFFYYRDWRGVDYDAFVAMLDEYIADYNMRRIKKSLGWMSPVEYRQSLGLAA